jgi:hypothetical protein
MTESEFGYRSYCRRHCPKNTVDALNLPKVRFEQQYSLTSKEKTQVSMIML